MLLLLLLLNIPHSTQPSPDISIPRQITLSITAKPLPLASRHREQLNTSTTLAVGRQLAPPCSADTSRHRLTDSSIAVTKPTLPAGAHPATEELACDGTKWEQQLRPSQRQLECVFGTPPVQSSKPMLALPICFTSATATQLQPPYNYSRPGTAALSMHTGSQVVAIFMQNSKRRQVQCIPQTQRRQQYSCCPTSVQHYMHQIYPE